MSSNYLRIAILSLFFTHHIAYNGEKVINTRRQMFKTCFNSGVAFGMTKLLQVQAADNINIGGQIKYSDESLMSQKGHGTTDIPVQENLKYGVPRKLADKICSYNRHFAENAGFFQQTSFRDEMLSAKGPVTFYDSVSGKPLFVAPVGRTVDEFLKESAVHGWPSFRDSEVVWENVRVLRTSGETVSMDGTHLGHNLPDKRGNRYCINLVSVAGNPV